MSTETPNGQAANGPIYRLDRKDGTVVLAIEGIEYRLKPTMAAAEEIETTLERGMPMVVARLQAAAWPYAPVALAEPKAAATMAELATIFAAGARAGGLPLTQQRAKEIIWPVNRTRLVVGLLEFVTACNDGGRLRAEDLKNEASPSGSRPEPNGADATAETVEQILSEMETTAPHSDATSG